MTTQPYVPQRHPLGEALDMGRSLRSRVPRSLHAELRLPERDPVAILEEQNVTRLQHLIPVRMGRMLQSPFTYYRGTAAVMAHDLAGDTRTGQIVVACGDAHISNFGLYASPERRVLFDLNDFDEAWVAPWEWDVKRLAASAIIGGRDNGFTADQCRDASLAAVRGYRNALGKLFTLSALERFYFHTDTEWLEEQTSGKTQKVLRKAVKQARRRTSDQVIEKIVVRAEGERSRIVDQPPVIEHLPQGTEEEVARLLATYRTTLRFDTALLLVQFELVDYVLRVVGVGSVGTRCFILLLEGPNREPLFLQVKEAPPSVLTTYGGMSPEAVAGLRIPDDGREGWRVVAAQRVLQAQSDPFLGWIAGHAGDHSDHRPVDYYWRQFRDMKGSVDVAGLTPSAFCNYTALCGAVLARAHSQSSGAGIVAGYLGNSERFDESVTSWAVAYADQTERDFAALEAAVKAGRLPAERGV